jgi:hypothetical protein
MGNEALPIPYVQVLAASSGALEVMGPSAGPARAPMPRRAHATSDTNASSDVAQAVGCALACTGGAPRGLPLNSSRLVMPT